MAIEKFIRQRIQKLSGARHGHAGQHSHQMRMDAKELCFPGEIGGHGQSLEVNPTDEEITLFQEKSIFDEEVEMFRHKGDIVNGIYTVVEKLPIVEKE